MQEHHQNHSFLLMCPKTESAMEQRHRQDCEDLEDRCGWERDDDDYRHHQDHEEADQRHECRIERQLQIQSEMMQMFMVHMLENQLK
jgi:hypothetical protein